MLILVIVALSEVEFHLEFSCLFNHWKRKDIDQIFVKDCVLFGVDVKLFDIEEHFVDDRPLRQLLYLQVEDVFTRLTVHTADCVFEAFYAIERISDEVGREVH